jgi:uncharacterized membrane protein YbhN (UPF0104 family)
MLKDKWLLFAKILATLLILALILWQVPLRELLGSFSDVRPWPLLIAIALTPAIQGLKIAKWHYVVRQAQPSLAFRRAAVSLLVGVAAGLITPGRVGELTRVMYLDAEHESDFLSLVVVDRAVDLTAILLFAGISVGLLLAPLYGLGLVIGAVLLSIGLGLSRMLAQWMRESKLSFPGKRQLTRLLSQLHVLRPQVIARGLGLSALILFLALVQFYWLLTSFQPVSLEAAFVSFPLLLLAGVLPITVGGIGVREGTAVLLLADYGVAPTAAIDAAFLSFTLNTLIPAVIGAFLITIARRSRSVEQDNSIHWEEV